MAYSYNTTDVNPVDVAPNTGLPFEVMTSYNSGLFQNGSTGLHGGGDVGYGALKRRNVATDLVMYKPYDNALDTIMQLAAKFVVSPKVVMEWIETDELLPDEAVGLGNGNATTTINGNAYTPATTGNFFVSNDNGKIFRIGDRVRYADENGEYTYAYILNITVSTETTLALRSLGTGNLVEAASATAVIQRLHRSVGGDLDYDPQPRYALPKMYYTLLDKHRVEDSITQRAINEAGASYFDYVSDKEDKMYSDFRRGRELAALYGSKDKFQLPNGDWVYSSPGLWDEIKDYNRHVANNIRSAANFKNMLYRFIELTLGAESGGPKERTVFIDATFSSLLSQAFEDKQRFYETEFVAGVRCMRFEHNLGNLDFVHLPIFDYKHPLVGSSIKESTPRAIAMMLPVAECVTRVTMNNEGPTQSQFFLKGGDETEYMRVQSTEGTALKLKQYTAVLEEGTIGV